MLKYLLSFFKNHNAKEVINTSKTDTTNNSIIFHLDQNQKINVDIDLNNLSTEDAKQFGLLLFLINEGYYVQSFLDIISNISKVDTTKTEFVQSVISSWSNAIIENDNYVKNNQDPIIKPTQFNITTKQ
jgi:hypothetical protein